MPVMKFLSFAAWVSLACAQDYRLVPDWPKLPAGMAKLNQATAVAVGKDNRVFIAHRNRQQPIMVFDGNTGQHLLSFGEGQLLNPHGLNLDSKGHLWITDIELHQVFEYSPAGKQLRAWGEKGKPGLDKAHFDKPTNVAVAPSGEFYVADGYGNSRIAKFGGDGRFLTSWGKPGKEVGEFNMPHGIALDGRGRVFVCDRGNSRIQVFDPMGKPIMQWQSPELGRPWGIEIAKDGSIFVVDGDGQFEGVERSRALKVNAQGKVVAAWGSLGLGPGQFDWAHDIAVGPDGAVYVSDVRNGCRVQKFVAH
jgi:peptidylamidoglycolate lyase